jgi:phosphatidylserine decarboxylase
MRKEPLDTLDKIQDAFIRASRNELRLVAKKLLDPQKIQIVVVADKDPRVKVDGRRAVSLEENLKALAKKMGLPFREVEWR